MFDAIAAHVNIGDLFFAEVHVVSHELSIYGVKVGDIILCRHLTKTDDCLKKNVLTHVWVNKDDKPIEYRSILEGEDMSWLVYSGNAKGGGFICDHWMAKALAFLGGEWLC